MIDVAVLIPCYNEEATIKKVVADCKNVMPEAVIFVYDNNSIDKTSALAKEAGAIVRYERKQGKGNVIRRMFRDVDAKCYIMLDGDDTYPVEAIPQMAELVLNQQADMVVGDRLSSTYFTENKRPFHNFGNKLVRSAVNSLFKNNIQDIMTGYRAFSYEFVKTFPILSQGFEIETEMTVHALDKNMAISNVIIDYRDRPAGSISKLSTYKDGARVIKTILKLFKDYRPLAFFSLLSLILVVISAIMFIPVLATYLKTGLVPNFPTLIVSGFLALAAIQSFFGGMILDTVIQKARQDFEFKLQTICQKKQELLTKESQKDIER